MWGAVFGDIIGSVYEWHNTDDYDFPLFSRESRFTDDTVLSAAIADCIMHRDGSISDEKAYVSFIRLYYGRYPTAGFGEMFARWAGESLPRRQSSFGNGGAMRVCPIGWAFDNEKAVLSEARKSCIYTHNHRDAIRAAQAVALCVFLARRGASKDEIRAAAEKTAGYRLDYTLESIVGYGFDSSAAGSVPHAITAFLESASYEDAVRRAIILGGDSDTIACIAGGIAHAFYGGIPREIFNAALLRLDSGLRRTIKEFCERYCVECKLY